MPDAVRLALTDPARLGVHDAPAVLGYGLSGAVLARLPQGHPLAPSLRPQRLALMARHMRVKAALIPLLSAWAQAGIRAVLMKGFASAEFVYTDPSERFYGDVDVLIDERDAVRAVRVAQQLQWTDDGFVEVPSRWTHEVAHLYSPDREVRLDVHRRVARKLLGTNLKVKRATWHLWNSAQPTHLGSAPVWLPDPRDQVLMLALTRGWSTESGRLKPADPLDLIQMYARYGLTDAEVLDRAATLGCLHTMRATLRACRTTSLDDRATKQQIRRNTLLDLNMMPIDSVLGRVQRFPTLLKDILAVLPDALRVRRAIARGGDPRELPTRWTLAPARQPNVIAVARAIRAANWTLRLVYPGGATCVPRSLTRYAALCRAGVPVTFVSGVRRTDTGIEGHAWIELPFPLDNDYGEPQARTLYRELFRHAATTGQGRREPLSGRV
ncbi:lasso peptide biosynthesis B2 protein [Deinococcus sp. KNUC1210]|uniref:lasso peptide biosynthesis B2 protein n=1 Tax=Deinococcus sp. KNUC1210 TaxID=2917691 RepID=UPI001EF11057|nr:lasso peptide biosynthesis B2 protein [Deinococcus sp. KNUC1210]ULH16066.1 lasso peptide biosynthesis B2 protein [Deinococcus sp. KNUC1210]